MKTDKKISAIVLAAGQGTRMKSSVPKVLQTLLGQPMLSYPLQMCLDAGASSLVVVVGENRDQVKEALSNFFPAAVMKKIQFAVQDKPLGTAHAVEAGLKKLSSFRGDILIANGDLPLMTTHSVASLIEKHQQTNATLSFVTAVLEEPGDYGRVRREYGGDVSGVVEAADATDEQKMIREVNVGAYLVDSGFLRRKLQKMDSKNEQGEFYLPDLIEMALTESLKVETLVLSDTDEGLGANTQAELSTAVDILSQRHVRQLMQSGVRIIQPHLVIVESGVTVGHDTVIYGPSHLMGKTSIGSYCVIEPGNWIQDSSLGDHVHLRANCYLAESQIGDDVSVGPMAHLRPKTILKKGAKVGNFVEVKKSVIGEGSKINHLSYIGDAKIGKKVNVGAGTITCNYDGAQKFETIIEDDVFIGSDSQLVAPVQIGQGAYVGSGSTITKNVASGSLALSRVTQTEIKGWAKRKKRKK